VFVHASLLVAPEQLVIELVGFRERGFVDCVRAAQEVAPLQVPYFDGGEAAVAPLSVVAPVARPRRDHRVLFEIPLPGLVEQRVKILGGVRQRAL
jgi:hypothetical protein